MVILITSVLNCASDKLAISSSLSCIFSGAFNCSLFWAFFFFVSAHLLPNKGWSLRCSPRWGNCPTEVWRCVRGRGQGTVPVAPPSTGFQSLSLLPTNKLGPSGADSQMGGFVYVLGVGLSNELACEAGSFSRCHSPHRFLQPEALRLPFPVLKPWIARSHWLPSRSSQLSARKCGATPVLQCPPCFESSLLRLPVSAPLCSLDECFFCNSLVVRLPYSLIFWQFWLIFVLKFVFDFLAVLVDFCF